MKKISNSKLYIIISLIIICLLVALAVRLLFQKKEVYAFVSPLEVYLNEPVFYSDSTYNASQWFWEFGNGAFSNSRYGEYRYPSTGTYQIRLTVDNSLERNFIVNVRERVQLERDSLIRISAPYEAMQGEFVVFRGVGHAREWRWSFGETGIIDSREQVAIYAFNHPGLYMVELMTEDTQYPIMHEIQVLPVYEEDVDTHIEIGNDIREKLQAIVDGKPFNPNYNHIMNKYLCNNPNLIVTVNGDKNNDFYSYCQGLKIIGLHNTTIQEVHVFMDEHRPGCLKKLNVTQVKHYDY
ncbi:MAG: PKD domain-containing protein [Tannerellaceae bacterium]|nr:PKD domain-containing protein [Tannerellaceae bacterium]